MRPILLRAAMIASLAVAACERTKAPAAGAAATAPMGTWQQWATLEPLSDAVRSHADDGTIAALDRATEMLARGQFKSADEFLATASGSHGRHWIAVARANVAALNFTVCIRGVAWRLEDGNRGGATDREADYSEERRIAPGDISVEATLTNLDAAVAAGIPALVTQARIARARVAAFASRCPANKEVASLAETIMEKDLATLAAEASLTPDLAYLWAGVQMSRFSGAAARPFLEQASEGGFDHPAVTYMLAVIALEARELQRADTLAQKAIATYAELGDKAQQAQGQFIRGEIAAANKHLKAAEARYKDALGLVPTHVPSMIAVAKLRYVAEDEAAAVESLQGSLATLLLAPAPLDQTNAREAAANVESLVIVADEPFVSQIVRDALLADVDDEPDAIRRGVRYFYAATLEVRLREYKIAHGHGVMARDEFAETDVPAPINVDEFLDRLVEATQR